MRCWVYIPTGASSNPNVTPAERTEVEVESLPGLLEKLANEAPLGTRVVAFGDTRVTHYVLQNGGWAHKLEVIVA
jgi:hypothetical protein